MSGQNKGKRSTTVKPNLDHASGQPKNLASSGPAFPLSYAQKQLWFLHQLDSANPAYNTSCALRLEGNVKVDALRDSINAVIARHEILRTTFHDFQGTPKQIVLSKLTIDLPVIDPGGLPGQESINEIRRLASAEIRESFNLEQGPLIRGVLFKINGTESVLLLSLHHIVIDGWST